MDLDTETPTSTNPPRRTLSSWGGVRAVTIAARILFGATFIFSGFVKAVDPWGTFYKLQDYLGAWHIDMPITLVLLAAFTLFTVEFLIGVCVLLGSFRRVAAWLGGIFMAVMLPLTLWIALADPVADCGCFGDAVVISNWATFWKNVALTILIIWLIAFNRRVQPMVRPALQWLVFVSTCAYAIGIGLYGYVCQPLIDFRPYPVGSALTAAEEADNEADMTFVYEKDGQQREFSMSELPDESDGWTFVERHQTGASESEGLRVFDTSGETDMTDEVFFPTGRYIVLFIPDLRGVSIASSWLVNSLHTWAENNGVQMVAVAAGTEDALERWRDLSMASYPIYMAEDTTIKEVVRGNPGVVYVEDGIIKWKSTLRAIDADDFLADGTSSDPMSFARADGRTLWSATWLYGVIIVVLVAMSQLSRISFAAFRNRKN